MQWFRFYIYGIALLFVGLTISLSACQKGGDSGGGSGGSNSGAPTSPTAPVAPVARNSAGGGGIDGSGGDSVQSSLEEVKKAFAEEQASLMRRLSEIESRYLAVDEEIFDYMYGSGSYKIVGRFLVLNQGQEKSPDTSDTRGLSSPLIKNLLKKNIVIKSQQAPCEIKDGDHAGSARGNYEKGEICVSFEMLRHIQPFVLKMEVFTLLIHELSHLAGFEEAQAVEIQRLLTFHRNMYAHYRETGFINGIQACDFDALSKENAELTQSPYWQEQKRKLVALLSGSQPRGCGPDTNQMRDKVDIFTDDAEFMDYTAKFPRNDYRWELNEKAGGYDKTYFSTDSYQEISDVASIHLETSTAVIWNLSAQIGTDAQCSPKMLVANLIANIPDVLQIGCGENRLCRGRTCNQQELEKIKTRIRKEKEILEGDPNKSK